MFSDADRRLAVRASANHSVFTIAHARAAGLTHRQIDHRVANTWIHLYESVYRMPGAPQTWRSALLAGTLAATPPAAISHRSAAALYELPGGRDDLVELTCKRWLRTRHPGLVVHESTRIDERDMHTVDGITVMRPERVVLELAGFRPSPRFIEAVIHAARRRRLITFESTAEMFDRHARRGLRGVQALRTVLEQWNPNSRPSESEMETLVLQLLAEAGHTEAIAQFEIVDRQGVFIARADVALPESRIAIEYDSKQEHSDEFQLARDAQRRNKIVAAGWRLLTARHGDVVSRGADLLETIDATTRSV